jgi:hypothetical protein
VAWALDPVCTLNAGLNVSNKTGDESKIQVATWCVSQPTCSGPTLHHVELHRVAGTTPSSAPSAGTLVVSRPVGTQTVDSLVMRANKAFAYRIFACTNAACSSWWGSSGPQIVADRMSLTTEMETWTISGIAGGGTPELALIPQDNANAPDALPFPNGWTSGYAGKVLLYFSRPGQIPGASHVYAMMSALTTWPDATTYPSLYNDPAVWEGGGTPTETVVLEGATNPTRDDYLLDHPWAMLTEIDGVKRVELFTQTQYADADTDYGPYNDHIVQVPSVDTVGLDFGDAATLPLDTEGYVAIAADGTSATNFVDHARHSRIAWDYIQDPVINATDEPSMLFQLQRPATGSDCVDSGYDDIGWADGYWDSTIDQWIWEVFTDGGAPDCPLIQVEDGHDNSIVGLPGNEFKMYYKDYTTTEWHVVYWDGSDWVDDTEILVVWDGGSSSPNPACIENVGAFIHFQPPAINEGMFFRMLDNDYWECGGGGFDDDDEQEDDDGGIVFAELSN